MERGSPMPGIKVDSPHNAEGGVFAKLRDDLKERNRPSVVLLATLVLTGTAIIARGSFAVAEAGLRPFSVLVVLGLFLALTSARHTIHFPGTRTSVSLAEIFTFFAAITLG